MFDSVGSTGVPRPGDRASRRDRPLLGRRRPQVVASRPSSSGWPLRQCRTGLLSSDSRGASRADLVWGIACRGGMRAQASQCSWAATSSGASGLGDARAGGLRAGRI
eukprot:1892409-Alexandrium_andersonii.AAC.1